MPKVWRILFSQPVSVFRKPVQTSVLRDERDHDRHVDEGPERALAGEPRMVHEQGEAQAREHRDGDDDERRT